MKAFIILALSLGFVVTQSATAEDVVQNRPTTMQRVAAAPARGNNAAVQPSAGVRRPAVVVDRTRAGITRNYNGHLRRNYPASAQPIQRRSLAMNIPQAPRNSQPRQVADPSVQGQNVSLIGGDKPQNAVNNLQRANRNRHSYADALKRCCRERHDCNWWRRHCRTIVFVNTGYYYLDAGYSYPAYGYDPAYSYYDYDGPIYTYGNLLPDQVIANVQLALKEAGYYVGPITGSLGPATRAALANFQRDYGLVITGAIDEPTVQSLGLI
jgi:hypothetical protein